MEKNQSFEIAYSINPEETLNFGCLVLDLVKVVKDRFNHSVQNFNDCFTPSQLRVHTVSDADREVLNFLLKEEALYQQRQKGEIVPIESLRLKKVHLHHQQVSKAISALAPLQKLYCNGRQLVVDLFGEAIFYYEGTSVNPQLLEVKGRIKWAQNDFLLSECSGLIPGNPPWVVAGISLKKIAHYPSWKELAKLKQSPLLLEGREKKHFLDDIDPSDSDSPQLIIKDGLLHDSPEKSPFPLLKLTDKWGAFANLWMDYGEGYYVPYDDPRPFIKNGEGKLICKRQLKDEDQWERDLFETDFIKKHVGTSKYYCPLDKVAKSLTFLIELGWNIEDYQSKKVVKESGLNLQFSDNTQSIQIKGELKYDEYTANLHDVLGAFNRKEQFIQLSDHTVGLLPIGEIRQTLSDLSEETEITGQEIRVKKSKFGALESLWETSELSSSLMELKHQWKDFKEIQSIQPSEIFHGQLRPYQQTGLNWLMFLNHNGFHGILADEMGLGKTIQILAFLSCLPLGKPHLILLPTSLVFNWRNEIQRFLPSFKVVVHQGSSRFEHQKELIDADIILTSYTILRLDLSLFKNIELNCLILDEAQVIKNASTLTAQAVCQLNAQMRISLTGTPVENHLLELWSHFRFLIPDLLGSQEQFQAELLASQSDRRYLDRIKKKVNPFFLRRKKIDVAKDLPPRIDQVVWIEMADDQRCLYDQMLVRFKSGLLKKIEAEGTKAHRMEILEALLRLRQVCCHPLLVSQLNENSNPTSAKFDALFEDLQTVIEEGQKVLVYSQFTSMLNLMAKESKARGWDFGYLDGSTTNREDEVNRFQNDPNRLIFFISLKAGGVGLNLTAADYVYLYDPWWNEAVEEQAINRAHRIGREDPVIAKRFVIIESIEEKMMKLKASKRLIAEDLFDAENLSELTVEDLKSLFS